MIKFNKPTLNTTFYPYKSEICLNKQKHKHKQSVNIKPLAHIGFFLGLMDGDGFIQVNHWRKKYLQHRFVIKLPAALENREMLQNIALRFGGKVFAENKGFVLWTQDRKPGIRQLLNLMKHYAPLTKRLRMQVQFSENMWAANDVMLYLSSRGHKYQATSAPLALERRAEFLNNWISGFIEAQGCFSLGSGSRGWPSFSIGQHHDPAPLHFLRDHFGGTDTLRLKKGCFYMWKVYRKTVLQSIGFHLEKYPLQGAKALSAAAFFSGLEGSWKEKTGVT